MSSRLNPRHYFTRSQGSQSSDAEDPSRQVSGETYQGDFATMDPAMQVRRLYLRILHYASWLMLMRIARERILYGRGRTPAVGEFAGYAAGKGSWEAGWVWDDEEGVEAYGCVGCTGGG